MLYEVITHYSLLTTKKMARTITEISNSMIDDVQKNEHLKNILTSDSKTAVWRNIIYVITSYSIHYTKLYEGLLKT